MKMTVRELIKALSEMPPLAEVKVMEPETDDYEPVVAVTCIDKGTVLLDTMFACD
jgi:hypothetical protein